MIQKEEPHAEEVKEEIKLPKKTKPGGVKASKRL